MKGILLWLVLVAGALVWGARAGEGCEGSYKDYEYSVDASRIEEIRVTSRVGLVVVQHTESSDTRSPRGSAAVATGTMPTEPTTSSTVNNNNEDEETPTRPPTEYITVKTRVKASDADTVGTMRVDLDSSYGILTALVCPDEDSDSTCYSKKMRGSGALVNPSLGTFGFVVATLAAAYNALPPQLVEAGLVEQHDEPCATAEVTLVLPPNWRGILTVVTESADVAFNNEHGFVSLGLETWSGHVSAVWEAPIEVDETLTLKAHDHGSTMFLANVELTGLGERDCAMTAAGNGEITFSFLDLPPKTLTTKIDVDVMDSGYFDVPNLHDADGVFSATRSVGAQFSVTGDCAYDSVSDTFVNGTMRTGTGKHSITARSTGGQIVIFCKKEGSSSSSSS